MTIKALGAYMRGLRNGHRLTQDELASRLGVDGRTVRNWESGHTEPTITSFIYYLFATGGSGRQVVAIVLDDSITPSAAYEMGHVWAVTSNAPTPPSGVEIPDGRGDPVYREYIHLKNLSKDQLIALIAMILDERS